MAKICARVVATFQRSTTFPGTDVLSLDIRIRSRNSRTKWSHLALTGLTFESLALAGTASFAAFMPTTVQSGLALAHTLWRLLSALVTDCFERVAATTTGNVNRLHAWKTIAAWMANLCAWVSASQLPPARLLATRDRVSALLPVPDSKIEERRFPAGTVCDDIWRAWTMRIGFFLRVTLLLATMLTAVILSITNLTAIEDADPIIALFLLIPI